MDDKIIDIRITDNYRIIAISDVHGHHDHLKALIKKINLRDDDYLIFIGDFINKGTDSFETYKQIRKLSERENTYVLKGNHEQNIQTVMSEITTFESVYENIKEEHYETVLHAIFRETNQHPHMFDSPQLHFDHLHDHHSEVFEFIGKLPIVLNIDEFKFVHGGYEEEFCPIKDERKFLKYDHFNELSGINDRMTVVGHWPSCLLRDDKLSNSPYFNEEKNIIFIDGGMGVKASSELNALVIEKSDGIISYDTIQHNDFQKKRVIKTHEFKLENKIYINYPHYEIEVIDKGDVMTLCRHVHTKKEFSIFNSLIMEYKDALVPKIDYVNNFLNLEIGDEVEVCDEYDECFLVKYNDEFGWLMNFQLG